MEFLQNTSSDEDEDHDEDEDSFVTAPLPPILRPIAMETLPLRYDHSQREGLAAAVALGGRACATSDPVFEDYYTLRLRGADHTHAAAAPAALGYANALTRPCSADRRSAGGRRLPPTLLWLRPPALQHLELHPIPWSLLLRHTSTFTR